MQTRTFYQVVISFCFFIFCLFPGHNLKAQAFMELNENLNGVGTELEFTARDSIVLSSGFEYSDPYGFFLSASIDPSIFAIIDTSYQSIKADSTRELDTDLPVGTIPGNFNVSASGAASYHLPIKTPPGTAGMSPSVSINYNSQGGNGSLGLGWSIGGTSSIYRVGQNLMNDNNITEVRLDTSDRFALDGNRLVQTYGTNYGEADSKYHTWNESFSEITAKGISGTGPSWFEVTTKSGDTIQYGNTTDSKIEAVGSSTPYQWRINKVQDKLGKYMKYEYKEVGGSSVLTRILYTGIESGMDPYNEINFRYRAKTDYNRGYIYGHAVCDSLLLERIVVYAEGEKVREYEFKYALLDDETRLNEIIEYDASGNHFNSTLINWSQLEEAEMENNRTILSNVSTGFISGDFNADGKQEIIRTTDGNMYGINDSCNNFVFLDTTNIPYTDKKDFQIGDFNGDGKEDLIQALSKSDTSFLLFPSNGTNFSAGIPFGTPTGTQKAELFPGDYNGDGLFDVFVYNPDDESKKIFWGDKNNPLEDSINLSISNWEDIHFTGDFDGDGKMELINFGVFYYYIYEWNQGSFQQIFNDSLSTKFLNSFEVADFNADGKSDILIGYINLLEDPLLDGQYEYKGLLSKGNGLFSSETAVSGLMSQMGESNFGDLDGDGKQEMVFIDLKDFDQGIRIISYDNGFSSRWSNIDGSTTYYIDFDGDGIAERFSKDTLNYMEIVKTYQQNSSDRLVSSITNGFNNSTKIIYQPITNDQIHSFDASGVYPLVNATFPQKIVSEVNFDNGIGGRNKTNYFYSGATLCNKYGQYLGFKSFSVVDSLNRSKRISSFSVDTTYFFPYLAKAEIKTLGDTLISKTEYSRDTKSLEGNKTFFSFTPTRSSNNYLDNTSSADSAAYDNYGNMIYSKSFVEDEAETVTQNSYVNVGGWCLNRLQQSTTTMSREDVPDVVNTSRYLYYTNGLLKQSVVQPQDSGKVYTNMYYDTYGNLSRKMISPDSINGRNAYFSYDSKGRMLSQNSNDLNQYVDYENNYKLGLVTSSTDFNGFSTSYSYDGFGNLQQVQYPDSSFAATIVEWDTTGNHLIKITKSVTGSPDGITYLDKLGRSILAETTGFTGDKILASSQYNQKGQLEYVTLPYYEGDSNSDRKEYTYDYLGRVSTETAPGLSLSYQYNGLSTTVTDNLNSQSYTKTMDATGMLVSSTDPGGSITYDYYANGQLKETSVSGNTITREYDKLGRSSKLIDPNSGTTFYGYSPYGELNYSKDANDRIFTFAYDTLGRMTNRHEEYFNTQWQYSTNGTLERLTSTNGYAQIYDYDDLLRPESVTDSIGSQELTTAYSYDENGRVSEVTYPGGFGVTYTYQNGALKEIHRSDNDDLIWQLNDVTARGEITSVTYGNSLSTTKTYNNKGQLLSIQTGYNDSIQDLEYSYNSNGTMQWRKDHRHSSITENFIYDNLKRLTASIVGTDTISIEYASNGNIESKSDLGDYAYSTIHPNAVINVSGSDSMDLNEENISYTSFNKIDSLTQGDNQISFMYGSDYSRKKAISTINNTETTKYYSGIYEKSITLGQTKELYYIMACGSIVAMYEKTSTAGKMYYVHTDHLGSVNCVTDSTGSIVQESSYDAWGNRRDPVTLEKLDTIPTNLITTRGYTGHEHMDEFGLINMNGRIYDPKLARFLNPDPVIANPTFTQDYNAYSYVRNNPLGYVDPSGYISQALWNRAIEILNDDKIKFGGSVSDEGVSIFKSQDKAFDAGVDYNNTNDSWGETEYKSEEASRIVFNIISGKNASKGSRLSLVIVPWKGTDHYFKYNRSTSKFFLTGSDVAINPFEYIFSLDEEASNNINASSQGGHGVDDYAALGVGAVGTYNGVMGDAFYSKYHHMQKNGTIRSAKFAKNNPNRIYQTSRNGVKTLTKNARYLSKGAGFVGAGISAYQFYQDPTYANAFDGAMGATAFIPVVGWAVSGTYFIANTLTTAISGQTIGEHIFGDKRVY